MGPTEDPRLKNAFPKLNDNQIEELEAFGTHILVPAGEPVWEAGQPNVCMFVVLDGEMSIVDGRSHEFIAMHEKGGFSGDVDVLSQRPAVVSAFAKTDLKLLKIPGDCVRSIVGEHPDLGDLILRSFLLRRSLLQESNSVGFLVLGSRYSPDTLRIREFLARNRYPFHWEDLDRSEETKRMLEEFNVCEEQTPVVVLQNGEVLKVPSNAELAQHLGIGEVTLGQTYDLVVIGAGPAGLAAAVYGASEGLRTLIIDEAGPGGQAGTSSRIENYMGFPAGVSGQELADRAVVQAERFGAQFLVSANVVGITCSDHGSHEVLIDEGQQITTQCVLLATGASYRKLDIAGQERYEGNGVYYAATNVERLLCTDQAVAVVGAGNSAGQAAVFMAEHAKHVFLVVRGDDIRKTMSSYLARRIEQSEKISILINSEVCELLGDGYLQSAVIVDKFTGQAQTQDVTALFVMIGAIPRSNWLPEQVACDGKGFVLTGPSLVEQQMWKQTRPPFFLETSCPGVFSAGDVRAGSIKRVASAVGEGSMAVAFVHQYLAL